MPANGRIRPAILARFASNPTPATASTLARELGFNAHYVRSVLRLMWLAGEIVVRCWEKTEGKAARCYGLPRAQETTDA